MRAARAYLIAIITDADALGAVNAFDANASGAASVLTDALILAIFLIASASFAA
jgi:hypothetical protein